jgi:hypothetical protein
LTRAGPPVPHSHAPEPWEGLEPGKTAQGSHSSPLAPDPVPVPVEPVGVGCRRRARRGPSPPGVAAVQVAATNSGCA